MALLDADGTCFFCGAASLSRSADCSRCFSWAKPRVFALLSSRWGLGANVCAVFGGAGVTSDRESGAGVAAGAFDAAAVLSELERGPAEGAFAGEDVARASFLATS